MLEEQWSAGPPELPATRTELVPSDQDMNDPCDGQGAIACDVADDDAVGAAVEDPLRDHKSMVFRGGGCAHHVAGSCGAEW
jgi:hypothetical protein